MIIAVKNVCFINYKVRRLGCLSLGYINNEYYSNLMAGFFLNPLPRIFEGKTKTITIKKKKIGK